MANTKKNKKIKNELVFDPKQREEFLTGFSKRKMQRKKKAKDETEQKLKDEVKRIREEVSRCFRKRYRLFFIVRFRPKTSKINSSKVSNQSLNSTRY